jgi:ribosomal protein L17
VASPQERISILLCGKKNDAEAKRVLKTFRDASTELKNQLDFDDEYVSLIKDLAKARDTDAVGLNELVEQLVELAKSPGYEKRRAALTELANECLEKTLALTASHPDLEEVRKKADRLQQEVNKLQ